MFVYNNVNVEGAERVAGVLIEGNGRMAVKRVGEWRENFWQNPGKYEKKGGPETWRENGQDRKGGVRGPSATEMGIGPVYGANES